MIRGQKRPGPFCPKQGGKTMNITELTVHDLQQKLKSKELTKEQKWMIDKGYIKGYGDGNYGWDDTLTRGQLAIILYRMVNGNGSDK